MRQIIELTLVLIVFGGTLFAADNDRLPVCPPDWKVDLIAQVPRLIHPSAVCVAPDGRVFVGQDPMNMGNASDKPTDYILCFHPNGKVTTFATNLYAVFGLSYLEGKLYVHHCPKVTVFRDEDGIGRDPVDLFKTNPHPWEGGFNDHIPANLHFAMDGYFYLATGDKGIYGAVGKDGSTAELQGGGIVRFRPDGTELEVYSLGTRNHLDVAINDEMEMFTYDNTDDGNGWWTRVTHMVNRGWYGYPHDYKPQRPYTLWMMKDYGGGSPTGAIAYNEDALPQEYHGNLFMSEWGKGQLERFVVERDGATYKIVSRQAVLKGAEQFRPVGVDVSADGMSFFVADWNYNGWKNSLLAGRLLKLSYTGKSQAAQKPSWYLPAALGKSIAATSTDELVKGFEHPSERVRLVAQRALAKRGSEVVKKLTKFIADNRSSPRARLHAIWALDAIDHGISGRSSIIKALADQSPAVRRQAARQLGTSRAAEAVKPLTALLEDNDKSVRFQAATALGRIGDTAAVRSLLKALDETDLFARYAAFTALNHIARLHPNAWSVIAQGLHNENARIREATLFAMRETFDTQNVNALAAFIGDTANRAETRAGALSVLAGLHRKAAPWNGHWWATQPVRSPLPAKVIEWEGTHEVLASVRAGLKDRDHTVRLAAINATEIINDTNAIATLAAIYNSDRDDATRKAILTACAAIKGPAASAFISSILNHAESHQWLSDAIAAAEKIGGRDVIQSLIKLANSWTGVTSLKSIIEALGNLKAVEAIPLIAQRTRDSDTAVRQTAINSLGKIGGENAVIALVALLDESDASLRREAVTALGATGQKAALNPLLKAWHDSTTRTEAITALAQKPDLLALDAYLDGAADKSAAVRDTSRKALQSIQKDALPVLEQRAAAGTLSAPVLAGLQRLYEKDDKARLGPIFAYSSAGKSTDPAVYAAFATKSKGDLNRGKRIFNDMTTVACIKCHKAEGQGGEVGPDLNSVGAKYGRAQIIEHILYPSKIILDGYQQTTVLTKDGETQNGIVRGESSDELTLLDTEGKKHVIPKNQIAKRKQNDLSLMPEGLQLGLSLQEFADLVAYVESLKDQPVHASNK